MRGKRTKVTVLERTEGTRNAAGEPEESWDVVTGGGYIFVHITPLSVAKMAALNQAEPGQVFTNSLRMAFRPGFDIDVDDRLVDDKGNRYVIQHVMPHKSHTAAIAGITNQV
ncbi:hypothetical protein LCGC14_1061850 [marine sediment metagenome]|uniref:Uncharacterized protein n=1 Tax=marine sediment metagenome TaxID=412755 RepID=A0A0F9Q3V0_9ZZZZ